MPPLAKGELIDDRALRSRQEDAFRLTDIADELLGICRSAQTPATIALYASWGSGKSSLGRILEMEFENDRETAYTRFDALKYAETPLRRHFLSQVATGFGVNDAKYGRDLYRSEKGTDFRVTPARVRRLVAVLTGAIGAVIVAIVVYALIAASIASEHAYWHNFGQTLRNSAGAVILSATALAAILALVSQGLRVDTSIDAPSSSEEFEQLFRELVADALDKTRCKRLVVFIDELDRCSPDQVVSVLETLRTFLKWRAAFSSWPPTSRLLKGQQRSRPDKATTSVYFGRGLAQVSRSRRRMGGSATRVIPRRLPIPFADQRSSFC